MPNLRDLDRRPVAIILAVIEVIMNEISKYVPITKAKNDLLDLIRQIESADESVAVTKTIFRGKYKTRLNKALFYKLPLSFNREYHNCL